MPDELLLPVLEELLLLPLEPVLVFAFVFVLVLVLVCVFVLEDVLVEPELVLV